MKHTILFCLLIVLAAALRFWSLGSFPSGLTWDEAAIGYNAYGLITNHRDEWLHRTPIAFQSFGDFKSPLLIYLETIPVFIFGLTPFAVRLPIALAGIGLVIVTYFLTEEITKKKDISLFVMFLISVSPWAIHYSRMGFESMLATVLVAFGVFGWLKGRREPVWLILGSIGFALSLYAYHSAKIVVPLAGLTLCVLYYKDFLRHSREFAIGILAALVVLLPFGYGSIFGKANARALSTTILGKPNFPVQFVKNYLRHMSQGFLLHGDDITYRHSTKEIGVLTRIEYILAPIAILFMLLRKEFRKFWWIPVFFCIGLVPASLGLDVPHSNRALLSLPWIQILTGIAVWALAERFKITTWKMITAITVLGFVYLISYVQIYTRVYTSAPALQELGYGYDDVMRYVRPEEGKVEHVYFTNSYGQAYIYILFFKRLTPMEYQHGGLANYTIANNPYTEANGKANVLIVGTKDEIPDSAHIVKEIAYPDGQIAWRIARQ